MTMVLVGLVDFGWSLSPIKCGIILFDRTVNLIYTAGHRQSICQQRFDTIEFAAHFESVNSTMVTRPMIFTTIIRLCRCVYFTSDHSIIYVFALIYKRSIQKTFDSTIDQYRIEKYVYCVYYLSRKKYDSL
jgi:hypothetical protein